MTDAFNAADGDAWFQRNKAALETAAEHDWPLKLIERNELKPKRVLEVGCANGWRLAHLALRHQIEIGYGVDLSLEAIESGQERYKALRLKLCHQEASVILASDEWFDLTIMYFVVHWIDRKHLLRSLAELDRVTAIGGHLLLGDFYPDEPTKTPYHHRDGAWTYKADYAAIFLATGLYHLVDRVVFDHDTGEEGDWWSIDGKRRAVVSLLQKGDWYQEAGR